MHAPERRKNLRIRIARSAKLFNHMTGKYVAGKTLNVSASGAMLVFDHTTKLLPGQRVQVGICEDPKHVVLASNDMLNATIIRSEHKDTGLKVAVNFDDHCRLTTAA